MSDPKPGSQAGSRRGSVAGSASGTRTRSGSQSAPSGEQKASGSRSRSGSKSPPSGEQKAPDTRSRSGSPPSPSDEQQLQVATVSQAPKIPGLDPDINSLDDMKRKYGNIDLPPEAFKIRTGDEGFPSYTRRPGYNNANTSKTVQIGINQFALGDMKASGKTIHQYDVVVVPVPEKQSFYNVLWQSKPVQEATEKFSKGWLHDGRRLAWAPIKLQKNLQVTIDMDKEKGQESRPGRQNVFLLTIRHVTTVKLAALEGYLEGKMAWDIGVLGCINFLDHVLRQGPSARGLLKIKRNFYNPDESLTLFGSTHAICGAKKGIYAAFTMTQRRQGQATGLAVNVDVANTTFWWAKTIFNMLRNVVRGKMPELKLASDLEISDNLRPVKRLESKTNRPILENGKEMFNPPDAFKHLRIMTRLEFKVKHDGRDPRLMEKSYRIMRFEFDDRWGNVGATADQVNFEWEGKVVSVNNYFFEKYKVALKYPHFPLVVSTRQGMFPSELCYLVANQRYNFKLTPDQTSEMIRFAVTKPNVRKQDIMKNVNLLNWQQDQYLQAYGIRINPQMTMTSARLLEAPTILFGNQRATPGTSGRWDLRGKRFLDPHSRPLKYWAIVSLSNRVGPGDLSRFSNDFQNAFKGHGGNIAQDPWLQSIRPGRDKNYSDEAQMIYERTQKAVKGVPQMIFVIVGDKGQQNYERLKKVFDCRYAVPSQILQDNHVRKSQAQYHSNVAMKVNAKLGGCTARTVNPGEKPGKSTCVFTRPTMIIGVDVSHAAVGQDRPSMAAITMSWDRDAVRYMAQCQTNGIRIEMLTKSVINDVLDNMMSLWCKKFGTIPQHIYYLRDGVAHSQFSALIDEEIGAIKELVAAKTKGHQQARFTVVVAQKRHHIRFFPRQNDRAAADKNNNAHPGTLVERDVTHPFHYDFYLSSHSAIQGTARPTHYHVLLDEAKVPVNDLQRLLYQQCYQYVRSTTPVSIHPAIYYAHLASKRAVAHEDKEFYEKSIPMKILEDRWKKIKNDPTAELPEVVEVRRVAAQKRGMDMEMAEGHKGPLPHLIPMGTPSETTKEDRDFLRSTMWFI